ncbi:copper resistance protein CopC [Rossellomorea arthrocnemi]|uniref:copper resistance protein CopC n=1 Tax=Rossellomorea arthrocnemi TaxID=2769542 RepID=UPI001918B02D|nr:copper resistance protein CopC [Rossellomorea arthrocnemi]
MALFYYRRLKKILILLLVIISIYPPLTGLAHSSLERTYPEEGEKLNTSPETIEVWFQDLVVLHSESIKVKSNKGNYIDMGKAYIDPNDKTHIIGALPEELPSGLYIAEINVIALDGFVMKERITFQMTNDEGILGEDRLKVLKYSPVDGEITNQTIKQIDLWFNKPAEITAIGVFDDKQQSIRLGTPEIDPINPNHLTISIEEVLHSGTYQVTWYARPIDADVSKPDIVNVFYFAVDEFSPIQQSHIGESTNSFSIQNFSLKQVGYWFVFIGLSILFGGSFFLQFIAKEKKNVRWRKISSIFLSFVVIGEVIILLLQKGELQGLSIEEFLKLKFTLIPLLQILFLALGYSIKKYQIYFYSVPVILMPFVAGHAAYPRYGGLVTMGINALHFLGAAIWIGGLFALMILTKKAEMKNWIAEVIPSFSKWAFLSLIIIIVTGFIMTFQYVPSFSASSFIESEWGKIIILKIIVTMLVVIIGFFQRRSLKKWMESTLRLIMKRVRVELIYSAIILLLASLLVVSTPGAAEQGVYPQTIGDGGDELKVGFSPLTPGLNVLTMDFTSKNVKDVKVNLSMPPTYNVEYNAFKLDEDTFKITGNLLHASGTMSMEVIAFYQDGTKKRFLYKVVVPGELRFNE